MGPHFVVEVKEGLHFLSELRRLVKRVKIAF
jgi:hypothetical protein